MRAGATATVWIKPRYNDGRSKSLEYAVDARSRHPIFKGQRFVVWDWQLENLMRLLGPNVESFGLDEWFLELDQQVIVSKEMVPQRDGGRWLEAKTIAEARRRGIPMTSAEAVQREMDFAAAWDAWQRMKGKGRA